MPEDGSRSRFRIVFKAVDEMRYTKTNASSSDTVGIKLTIVLRGSCFVISLLYASTCFEHCCAHHQEVKLYYTASGIVTPVGGRPLSTCAPDGHLQVS